MENLIIAGLAKIVHNNAKLVHNRQIIVWLVIYKQDICQIISVFVIVDSLKLDNKIVNSATIHVILVLAHLPIVSAVMQMVLESWNKISAIVRMVTMIMEVRFVPNVRIIVRLVHQIHLVIAVYSPEYW